MANIAPRYICLAAIAVLCASPSAASEPQPARGGGLHKINYIQKEIPSVPVLPYEGERYLDRVPDTLDIAERAALAVNALTGPLDPNADYELYWWVEFLYNPPVMSHDWNDWCGLKFFEALPLLRIASGSDLNPQVDPTWKDVILKSIGPDGLFYIPLGARPWSRKNVCWASVVYRADGRTTVVSDPAVTQVAHAFSCGRILNTITIYYLRDRNPIWKGIGEKMIDRLSQIAVDKGDYCYFPDAVFEPNAKVPRDAPPPREPVCAAESFGRLIQGPVQFYKATGYEPAIKLARKLANYMRNQSGYFGKDGSFIGGTHFHSHTIDLQQMLECAIAQNDDELKAYVKKSYEWAKRCPGACSLTGFFAENINANYKTCESCEVADMLALALKLSRGGIGDYWDDADRWSRNQFFESQLTRTDWVKARVKSKPAHAPDANLTTERVPERNIGAFAGWSTPNDWWNGTSGPFMHCCTGNATRAIYYLWEHMLDCRDGTLKVNLLMNRASKWADVYSYVPYEGRVDIKIKASCKEVSVRMPEWVRSDAQQKVACTINGKEASFKWDRRFVDLGPAQPGDRIALTFPISERTAKERIGGDDYTYTLRGNTVISVDPPGKICPIYQKDFYRGGVRWRTVNRFVSSEHVEW